MGAQGRDVILQISNLDLATQLKLELAAVQKVSVRLEHELHQQVTVLRRQKKNAAGQNHALKRKAVMKKLRIGSTLSIIMSWQHLDNGPD